MFSCKCCETFKITFFHRTPPAAASEKLKAKAAVQKCSVKTVFLEMLLNSQENTCARVFLQPLACNFIKIESLTQVFSCEFCEHLSKNTIFYKTLQVAASVKACNFIKIRLCHWWFFCELSKNFRNVFLMRCKNFLKIQKITGEKKVC